MDESVIEAYKKAGKIAGEALAYGKSLIKPGVLLLEVCDKVEEKILALGGGIAFPAQVSCNDIAAHFCPEEDDKTILKDQLVSLDVGVHIDGYIGDTACTVDLSGKNSALVKAAEEALANAIKLIKPGVAIGEIGKAIQDVIAKYGFAPIRNLCGHGLSQYDVHSEPSIPNFDTGDTSQLAEDMVIAIEPFASAGEGAIYESGNPTVFALIGKKPVRNMFTRQILKEIESYNGLPFAKRWITRKFGVAKANFALKELKNLDVLREYPPLPDRRHGLVSQAEHTILVKDKPLILTKL